MDSKLEKKFARDAATAQVEGLAEVKKTLEHLERKVEALARMVKAAKE